MTFDAGAALAALDALIDAQLDEILHHPDFRRLERSWRSLAFVVERLEWREGLVLEIMQATKHELLVDFDVADTDDDSGLFTWLYRSTYLQPDGVPHGVAVFDFEIDQSRQDVALAHRLASVGRAAHCIMLVGAQAATEVHRSLREADYAKNLGLCLPRFLLRAPHAGEAVSTSEHLVWGGAQVAFALCMANSFAKWGWCPNCVRVAGGTVGGLPTFEGACTSESFGEQREHATSEMGFVVMFTTVPEPGTVRFLTGASAQEPPRFGTSEEDRSRELDARLEAMIPYHVMVERLAHATKLVARAWPPRTHTRDDAEWKLNVWIGVNVADADVITSELRRIRFLRKAQIWVKPAAEGWRFELKVRPHFKHLGAFFTLQTGGRLDVELADASRA